MRGEALEPGTSPPAARTQSAAEDTTPRSRISPWLWWLLRPVHWVFMRVYFRLEVIGREHIPQNGPVILAPTHRSRWDTLALYCGTYRPLRFLTSHDEFAGTQNWFMRRMGAFPINTRRPTPGAMRHCRELLLGGQPLVIFPEGNLFYYPPNQVHPLKPGTAWLALDCQERLPEVTLTIVPVRLNYSDRVLRLRSRVRVEVGEPIPLKPYLDLPRKQGMARLTQDLQQALGDEVNTSTAELGHPPRD